jgi:glycerophosphoryl diester phosphodiesterase
VWPENGLTGFREVLSLAVDIVEFDVHLTKAGELLIIHDATLDRTTESTGVVADLAPGAHRQVRLRGDTGDTVPSFRDVLDVLAPSRVELHIELKSDADHVPYPGIVKAVLAELARYNLGSRAVLTSFDPGVLDEVRRLVPNGRRLASIDRHSAERLGGLESALRKMADLVEIVAIEKTLMREHWALINSIVPGDRLAVWTINEPDELRYWLGQPVRSLTSDRPDLAIELKGQVRG